MKFSQHDLRQIDKEYICSLSEEQHLQLTLDLLELSQELMDRQNQNSSNSSFPSSQDFPWAKSDTEDHKQDSFKKDGDEQGKDQGKQESQQSGASSTNGKKNPGKQPGAKGYGRDNILPVTHSRDHLPCRCTLCEKGFDVDAPKSAVAAHYVLDIEKNDENIGMSVSNTKHTYYEIECTCGHKTRAWPGRCDAEDDWSVEITQWHLCGPMLVSLIVCLNKRFHLSRRSIQEFLNDWLDISLSKGVINKCIHEAGRAVAPLQAAMIEEISSSELLNIDETSWKELSKNLWLWVFSTSTICLFLIGPRTKAVVRMILDTFSGTLMSDGYLAYRHYADRLRCWAHLERKLKGLSESSNKTAQSFGKNGKLLFESLKATIYSAREGPIIDISESVAGQLAEFNRLCREHSKSEHKKTREVANEFLNDWEAIWRVLSDVRNPLTNNDAERLLRHWVINRKISFGTRNNEGSRGFALLASVIETCRLRGVSPWPYLAQVISARRKNETVPPLPAPSNNKACR